MMTEAEWPPRSRLKLKRKNVFIVVGIPEHPVDVPLVAALSRYLGRSKEVDTERRDYEKRQAFVKREFAELSKTFPFHILNPSTLLCDGQRCRGLSDANPCIPTPTT